MLETTPHGEARHNLPLALTSFVGRDAELREIHHTLATTRLVTLTGVGGCGKTRLGIEVARGVLADFADGVWLAELGPIADPALVTSRVAATVGVRQTAELPLLHCLVDALRPRRLLLVLDNCEHVLDACAQLLEGLLRTCADVRVLATSRERIGIAGEVVWRVPSLVLPDGPVPATPRALDDNPCVRLIVHRAQSVQPRFALTERNAPAVVQICRRLDGIPLALELAAARVGTLTIEQVARRLDRRFQLLTDGSRTALPRQQTLLATLDWSYDLLTSAERQLFESLAVFSGSWTLEAVEAICASSNWESENVLDLLAALTRKSPVVAEEHIDGTERYRLMETVREYVGQRLAARGSAEVAAARERHAIFYSALAGQVGPVDQASPSRSSGDAPIEVVRDRIEAAYDNVRVALGWWLGQGRPVEGLTLADALGFFWHVHGLYTEGRRWLDDLLERADRTADHSSPQTAAAPSVPASATGERPQLARADVGYAG